MQIVTSLARAAAGFTLSALTIGLLAALAGPVFLGGWAVYLAFRGDFSMALGIFVIGLVLARCIVLILQGLQWMTRQLYG